MICTATAASIVVYAIYISSQVSGENLLRINADLGYKYATTYHGWQIAAVIAVIIAVVLWMITIIWFVKRRRARQELNK